MMKTIAALLLVLSFTIGAGAQDGDTITVDTPLSSEEIAQLHTRCDRNEVQVCLFLATLYEKGKSVEIDLPRMIELLEKSCSLFGSGRACNRLAGKYRNGEGIEEDKDKALIYYIRSCDMDAENAIGCANAGYMYLYGEGVIKNLFDAAFYLEKACERRQVFACDSVAELYNINKDFERNVDKVIKYSKIACELGRDLSCDLAAALEENPAEIYGNAKTAVKILNSKCMEQRHVFSCLALGNALYTQAKTQEEKQIAVKYFDFACGFSEKLGCAYLGHIYREGSLGEKNYEQSNKYYEKACSFGESSSCTNLGTAYATGVGVAKDFFKAQEFLDKACTLKDGLGCLNLGHAYKIGHNDFSRNAELAVKYYEKACALDKEEGCSLARQLKQVIAF
ncbi:tetratricopeptide repeat protein [Kordiimonas sp. SCSIO 12610]|uniref:tetratricopeptide repeat protein n=1 Tax=Kordiimonas sp. SCSIO 12610 TaxID=2829597 RepID=UPI00210E266B|nr:tetratricopeptide repeat protein [Kordiimonas sp. SCSIO 12610]UTW56244.1 sel1 repeat family protein [Kordiimonas sp. SCSIO 12610]